MDQPQDYLGGVASYWDSVAARYLELYREELGGKPYDLGVLKTFAAVLGPGAAVCDAGCGPCGHVARVLADLGLRVTGIDLSQTCVGLARREQPSIRFEAMDMGAMDFDDSTLDGLVAYYALHYQPKAALDGVIEEFARVLRPQGRLLVVAKEGGREGWIADPLGSDRQVFWCEFAREELESLVARNGFRIESCAVRDPLPDEIAARRIYVNAERVGP